MQFKIDQKVVCLKSNWKNGNDIYHFSFPVEYDVLTVLELRVHKNELLVSFKEFNKDVFYPSKFFRAVDYEFAEAILKNILKNAVKA